MKAKYVTYASRYGIKPDAVINYITENDLNAAESRKGAIIEWLETHASPSKSFITSDEMEALHRNPNKLIYRKKEAWNENVPNRTQYIGWNSLYGQLAYVDVNEIDMESDWCLVTHQDGSEELQTAFQKIRIDEELPIYVLK